MGDHIPQADLEELMLDAHKIVRPFSVWKHDRLGSTYVVHSVALRTGDVKPVVIYGLLGETVIAWDRPLEEFTAKFTEMKP